MHLSRLIEATDRALKRVRPGQFPKDGINYADLKCVDAEVCINASGDMMYRVYIEEASPTSINLQAFVQAELMAAGYSDVEVLTEW